ncbi:geranylgeranylglycerol-phosphate geranylgeranyltransferase [Haoranjiania flava]|uniref:Geranylgeranylglycerol-phosphate geranylgeranyltransferase n=1 Tax=Haoranjiania flava TaxID=1856322 RepID=A0AAE3ILW4_9BACT|nr:geranylgeranylglycerol-phosphate geranylgeranyltransferase [Haoranjiania flava]MCU7693381.1 geranylgeranylglycerol-phosphate geranylgeranyltransferase [Haoranjiania flava]
MKKVKAFFALVRWPNLVFIALTQYLFFYAVLYPVYERQQVTPNLNFLYLTLLMLSSVFIAGAGNIINDYFDLNIDVINKPGKVIIGKYIHRHWAISSHIVLSILGVAIGFYLDRKADTYFIGLTNLGCAVLLFVYSIVLKRKPLSGNIVISLLTAWTVGVVTFAETKTLIAGFSEAHVATITRVTILYVSFAFIISLVREMIKDMEDMEGDRRYNCRTFPILFGIPASKIFIYIWLFILIGLLLILLFYILQFRWWLGMAYIVVFVIAPLVSAYKAVNRAGSPKDFHEASSLVKTVMLTGICSMMFFWYYH